jgi:hypothetical protein
LVSKIQRLAVSAMLLFSVSAALGQQTSANCGGTVVDDAGHPLAGVEVVARDSQGRIWGRTLTNARGRYCLTDLVVGQYSIFQNPGKTPLRSDRVTTNIPARGLQLDWRISSQRALGNLSGPGATSCCKNFLEGNDSPAANISGTMLDLAGKPLAGIDIIVRDATDKLVGRSTTNELGRYCVTDLLPGRYTISKSSGGAPLAGETFVAEVPLEGLTVDWRVAANSVLAIASGPAMPSCCAQFLAGLYPPPQMTIGNLSAIGAAGLGLAGPAVAIPLGSGKAKVASPSN